MKNEIKTEPERDEKAEGYVVIKEKKSWTNKPGESLYFPALVLILGARRIRLRAGSGYESWWASHDWNSGV